MNCSKCGSPIEDGMSSCSVCGTPVGVEFHKPKIKSESQINNTPTSLDNSNIDEKTEIKNEKKDLNTNKEDVAKASLNDLISQFLKNDDVVEKKEDTKTQLQEQKPAVQPVQSVTPTPQAISVPVQPQVQKPVAQPVQSVTPTPQASSVPVQPQVQKPVVQPVQSVTPTPQASSAPVQPQVQKPVAQPVQSVTPTPQASSAPVQPQVQKLVSQPVQSVTPTPQASSVPVQPQVQKPVVQPVQSVTPTPQTISAPVQPQVQKPVVQPVQSVTPTPQASSAPIQPQYQNQVLQPIQQVAPAVAVNNNENNLKTEKISEIKEGVIIPEPSIPVPLEKNELIETSNVIGNKVNNISLKIDKRTLVVVGIVVGIILLIIIVFSVINGGKKTVKNIQSDENTIVEKDTQKDSDLVNGIDLIYSRKDEYGNIYYLMNNNSDNNYNLVVSAVLYDDKEEEVTTIDSSSIVMVSKNTYGGIIYIDTNISYESFKLVVKEEKSDINFKDLSNMTDYKISEENGEIDINLTNSTDSIITRAIALIVYYKDKQIIGFESGSEWYIATGEERSIVFYPSNNSLIGEYDDYKVYVIAYE